ncbi:hypothetical protein K2173_024352 [Erythroxylum novogranatense]|uniref:Protein kinase domain-containing protein n=1 Tax=Erythroxylum novogranatense TaxID=1862640 RepID=A0AAV8SU61_9ROSI|nr:hypothetical protein K2173_024352 [Erythroxylum novogranatense]
MAEKKRTAMATTSRTLTLVMEIVVTIILLSCLPLSMSQEAQAGTLSFEFGPFNTSYYGYFTVLPPATISDGALQLSPPPPPPPPPNNISTPVSTNASHHPRSPPTIGNTITSSRILFNRPFKLWEVYGNLNVSHDPNIVKMASFNNSFIVSISRNSSTQGGGGDGDGDGGGFAFLMAPDLHSTTDAEPSNRTVAIEFDTYNNRVALHIPDALHSNKTLRLRNVGNQIFSPGTKNYTVWIHYEGYDKALQVYIAEQGTVKPSVPVLDAANHDLRWLVNQYSYFGFAASTRGANHQLNSIYQWNLSVENLPSTGNSESKHSRPVKMHLVAGALLGSILLSTVVGCWIRKRRSPYALVTTGVRGCWMKCIRGRLYRHKLVMPDLAGYRCCPAKKLRYKDIKEATNNFQEELGEGSYGQVYKGVLPLDNLKVAVKKMHGEGLKSQKDIESKLIFIGQIRHRNLVPFLGWCYKNGKWFLVYEYMQNQSLDKYLFSRQDTMTSNTLNWRSRFKIIEEVARALDYLHYCCPDRKLVHGDLKLSNIMLDSEFNAHLGDFGLANMWQPYGRPIYVIGTPGYIARECRSTGRVSSESDIYSFGAVILNVVCGRRLLVSEDNDTGGFHNLVDWVWWLHRQGGILEAVDERLGDNYVVQEAERLLLLALSCSHPDSRRRPKTSDILSIISGATTVQIPPFKPAFLQTPGTAIDTLDHCANTEIVHGGHGVSNSITSLRGAILCIIAVFRLRPLLRRRKHETHNCQMRCIYIDI